MGETERHYGKDNLYAGIAVVVEIFAINYGAALLTWIAAGFICLAVFGYTKKWVREKRKRGWGTRAVAVTIILATAVLLTWPKKHPTVAATKEPGRVLESIQQPVPQASAPQPTTPHPPLLADEKSKKAVRERQKVQRQLGKDNIQTGPITTGPCSSVQVGRDNTATVNCVPPQRALTLSQQEAFVNALGPSPLSVSVYCYSTDKEGCTYAGSFFRAFKKAKWNTGVTVGMYFATPVDSEVYLTIQNQNERPQGFEEISRALTAVSVPLHGLIQSDLKPDEIRITVGRTLPD